MGSPRRALPKTLARRPRSPLESCDRATMSLVKRSDLAARIREGASMHEPSSSAAARREMRCRCETSRTFTGASPLRCPYCAAPGRAGREQWTFNVMVAEEAEHESGQHRNRGADRVDQRQLDIEHSFRDRPSPRDGENVEQINRIGSIAQISERFEVGHLVLRLAMERQQPNAQ